MTSEGVTYTDPKFMTLEKSQDQELQTATAKGKGGAGGGVLSKANSHLGEHF